MRYASHSRRQHWQGHDLNWQIDLENGDLDHDAHKIKYGKDEWKAVANKLLADYGFKLGAFDKEAGDRYELVEV